MIKRHKNHDQPLAPRPERRYKVWPAALIASLASLALAGGLGPESRAVPEKREIVEVFKDASVDGLVQCEVSGVQLGARVPDGYGGTVETVTVTVELQPGPMLADAPTDRVDWSPLGLWADGVYRPRDFDALYPTHLPAAILEEGAVLDGFTDDTEHSIDPTQPRKIQAVLPVTPDLEDGAYEFILRPELDKPRAEAIEGVDSDHSHMVGRPCGKVIVSIAAGDPVDAQLTAF